MVIQEAAEMYLETILSLKKKTGVVRAVDIAREMGYSKPTISEQMKKFRENGYVEVDNEGHITLTEKGLEIAEATLERHIALGEILQKMGVSKETAIEDACRIEHYISEETFECFKEYFKNK
jgi:hypothetical protein